MSAPPEKPGLELLIRRGGGAGFELKKVQADHAFLRLRPRRVKGIEVEERLIEEQSGREYMLRNAATDQYLRVNHREHYLWRKVDGAHTIQDLAVAYFLEFGSFEFEEIRGFLNKARRSGLLEVAPSTLFRARQEAKKGGLVGLLARLATFDKRWEDVDPWFERLYQVVGLLFSPRVLPLHLLVIGLGAYAYGQERLSHRLGAAAFDPLTYGLLFFFLAGASMFLHEVAHGLATKACGRRVQAVGVTLLDYVLPSLYVDITDMFMSTRAGRVAVSLAGPGCNLILASAATALAWSTDQLWLDRAALAAADANYALAIFTLWPFHGLKEDGYNAWTDLVKLTALRERAWQLLRSALPALDEPAPARPWRPLILYLSAVAASWLTLAALALWGFGVR